MPMGTSREPCAPAWARSSFGYTRDRLFDIPQVREGGFCPQALEKGLRSPQMAAFGAVPWQRGQFPLQQNAAAHVPRQELRAEVAADLHTIFTAADRATAVSYFVRTIQKYAKTAAKLARWIEQNVPEGLTVFAFPPAHRRLLRTSNGLERLNREIERRTRVVGIFPNEPACLRLISAVLLKVDEEWQTGCVDLTLEPPSSPAPEL